MSLLFADLGPTKKQSRLRELPLVVETGWRPPQYYPNLDRAVAVSIDVETKELDFDHGPGWARGPRGHIIGFSVGAVTADGERGRWYFPLRHEVEPEYNVNAEHSFAWLKEICQTNIPKVGANLLYDIGWLSEYGVVVNGPLYDCQFAEALLSEDGEVNLDWLGVKYLNEGKASNILYEWLAAAYGGAANGKQRANLYRAPPRLVGPYGEADADLPLRVMERQMPILIENGLFDLFRMECDLIPLLIQMRRDGQYIDVAGAEKLYGEVADELKVLQKTLDDGAGFSVNVGSGPDLEKLFTQIGLQFPRGKKREDKEGNELLGRGSFKKEFLEAVDHDAVRLILEIRQRKIIKDTFLDSYILKRNNNGFINCNFHPLRGDNEGTRSGRFSCVKGDTPILTEDGLKPIAGIVPGDRVWTHVQRWRPVIGCWIKGREPMLNITFSNGHILTCTIAHKLLTSDNEWVTVGAIANEYFKEMGFQSVEHFIRTGSLQAQGFPNDRSNSGGVEHNLSQYSGSTQVQHAGSGAKGFSCNTLLGIEIGRFEPDEKQDGRCAPQLDRSDFGRLRLFNDHSQRQTNVRAPRRDGGSLGLRQSSGCIRGSSYRRQPAEQSIGQLSAGNATRAPNYSFPTNKGQSFVTIAKIDFGGDCEVYDITVADDASYYACGVYSHNSDDPNLQNIPVRSQLGKKVRKLFLPDPGHVGSWKGDYSQVEYRALAHFAVGTGADRLRAEYIADPTTDYHNATYYRVCPFMGWDAANEEAKSERRKPIKTINFGLVFGMGETKLARALKLAPTDAKTLFNGYHSANPYVRETMAAAAQEAEQHGFIRTVLGRKSYFEMWEPTRKRGEERKLAMDLEHALQFYGQDIQRAHLHKAINRKLQGSAGDIIKFAMLKNWKDGVYAEIGVPRLQVHDELLHSVRERSARQEETYRYMIWNMENALRLRVPLKFDSGYGVNWGSIKA